MAFIMIDARIEEMGLDTYSKTVYQRIVFHARNSKLGHIESQENTAKATFISKRQIIRAIKNLESKKMILIKKYGKNKNAIFLTEASEWIFSSDSQSSFQVEVVTDSHHSSDCQSLHSHTLVLTRSNELDLFPKNSEREKENRKHLEQIGTKLCLVIQLRTRFFANQAAKDIVCHLYAKGWSTDDLYSVIDDIRQHSFLTSDNPAIIEKQIIEWPNKKIKFIAEKEKVIQLSDFTLKTIEPDPVKKLKDEEIDLADLPELFQDWFKKAPAHVKKDIRDDIRLMGINEFKLKRMNCIKGYLAHKNRFDVNNAI